MDCPSGDAWYGHVAVPSGQVAWSALEEHNHLYLGVHSVHVSKPERVRTVYSETDESVGALAASGDIVAFSTQGGFYPRIGVAAAYSSSESARSLRTASD